MMRRWEKCLYQKYFLVQNFYRIELECIIEKNKDLSRHSFNRQKNVKPISCGNTHLDFNIMDFIQCVRMVQVVLHTKRTHTTHNIFIDIEFMYFNVI